VWHFNPAVRPWYFYGYVPYPAGYYPGYEDGYYYTGNWLCTAYDDIGEEHYGGHAFRSTDYNAAYDYALDTCWNFHGESCVVSCQRE
jgi:hypothetical protein